MPLSGTSSVTQEGNSRETLNAKHHCTCKPVLSVYPSSSVIMWQGHGHTFNHFLFVMNCFNQLSFEKPLACANKNT